jgi:serine/threonine protein kinase
MSGRCAKCGDLVERAGGAAPPAEILCPLCRLEERLSGGREQRPPVTLGGVELLELAGRGPFGRVFKARSEEFGEVAVKVFAPNRWFSPIDPDAWRKIVIRHPGIATVLGGGMEDGLAWLVREWVPGIVLDTLVPPAWPDIDEAVRLIADVADALHHAHEQGILHGNLKPSNLIVDPAGKPRLVDFAVLRHDEPGDRARHAVQDPAGFTFWSPEQARGGPLDRRSDVYGLGTLLRLLLSGEAPFRPAAQRRALPPILMAIYLRATEFDPDQRFAGAGQLAEALHRYLQRTPSPESVASLSGPESPFETVEVAIPPPPSSPPTLSPMDALWASMAKEPPPAAAPRAPLPPPTPPAPARGMVLPAARRREAADLDESRAGAPAKKKAREPGLVGRLWGGLRNWLSGRSQAPAVEEAPGTPREITRRHSDISFPAKVLVARTYPLRVQIVPAEEKLPSGEVRPLPKPHEHDVRMDLEAPATERRRLRVSVSVAAENFEIDGSFRADIDVPLVGQSAAAIFHLRGLEVGPGRIMIDFSQDGRPVGSVDLCPEVTAQQEESKPAPVLGAVEIGPAAGGAPDVVLKVFEQRCGGRPGRLHFVLSSAHPALQDLPVLDGDLGTQDLRGDVASWVSEQLSFLGSVAGGNGITPDQVEKALADVGHNLFNQLLPERLRELCWVLRQRGVRSMLVLSDEPHIPWELIKPYQADPITGVLEKEDGCWGETFALTRWLRGRPPVRQFALGRVFALAVESGPASSTRDMVKSDTHVAGETISLSAGEEIQLLRSLQPAGASFVQVPANRRKLHEVFEKGGFDVLHLACHGTFGGPSSADASAVLLEDGLFPASELSPRMAGALRRESPLIFFNACHSGRLGFAPTGLGSWGARLVQLGCGGFIGSLWPVTDKAALAFARAFYEALLRGSAIGEAVSEARQRVHQGYPGDPTWLAYCCFADPLARVQMKAG